MALYKEMQQDGEVKTPYHRILYVEQWINSHISIAVLSYTSGSARYNEASPYTQSTTYATDYKENFTIQDAYAYLKSLPEFAGAEDV